MIRPNLKPIAATFAALLLGGASLAKLPPLSEDAKAKAAETAAKTAWGDKLASFQLCKAQDRSAANYQASAKQAGKEVKPPSAMPLCTDPGPYVPVASAAPAASGVNPLEAAGAHSPTATAAAPPSGRATTAEVQGQPKK